MSAWYFAQISQNDVFDFHFHLVIFTLRKPVIYNTFLSTASSRGFLVPVSVGVIQKHFVLLFGVTYDLLS